MNLKGTHLLVFYTDGGMGEFRLTLPYVTVKAQLRELLERPVDDRPGFATLSEPDREVFINLDTIAAIEATEIVLADASAVATSGPARSRKPPVRRSRAQKDS